MRFDFGQLIGSLRLRTAALAFSQGLMRSSDAILMAIHMNNH